MNAIVCGSTTPTSPGCIAFIGGGNMAGAIIGGLIRQGRSPSQIEVVEPFAQAREKLRTQYGVLANEFAGPALTRAGVVVWAVKPQAFKAAAAQARPFTAPALHMSVAAGIRSSSIADWLATERIVRSMPNTPALVGKGITALFARASVTSGDRQCIEQIISTTGDSLWVSNEKDLDAVTAISGSGPAYVFFFLEAMTKAGIEMGLSRDQALKLSIGTFVGASELARTSDDPPELLRERVTSKGGTTYAAITSMEQDQVAARFGKALHAARKRAAELGDEFAS